MFQDNHLSAHNSDAQYHDTKGDPDKRYLCSLHQVSTKVVGFCLANELCGSKLDVGMLIKRRSICCSNSLGQTGLPQNADSITEISKLYNVLKLLRDVILLIRLYELQMLFA